MHNLFCGLLFAPRGLSVMWLLSLALSTAAEALPETHIEFTETAVTADRPVPAHVLFSERNAKAILGRCEALASGDVVPIGAAIWGQSRAISRGEAKIDIVAGAPGAPLEYEMCAYNSLTGVWAYERVYLATDASAPGWVYLYDASKEHGLCTPGAVGRLNAPTGPMDTNDATPCGPPYGVTVSSMYMYRLRDWGAWYGEGVTVFGEALPAIKMYATAPGEFVFQSLDGMEQPRYVYGFAQVVGFVSPVE